MKKPRKEEGFFYRLTNYAGRSVDFNKIDEALKYLKLTSKRSVIAAANRGLKLAGHHVERINREEYEAMMKSREIRIESQKPKVRHEKMPLSGEHGFYWVIRSK